MAELQESLAPVYVICVVEGTTGVGGGRVIG